MKKHQIIKHHYKGFIVDGPDIIDIDLWRRRLKEDRRYYEKQKEILTERLEMIKRKLGAVK